MKFVPRTAAFLGVLACLFGAAPALGWGAKAHRIVCTMTWNESTEEARDAIRAILNVTAREQFAAHCARPDEHLKEHPERAAWHVLYLPPSAATIDLDRDCPMPASCVWREIERNLGVLKSAAPRAERAEALGLLAHLVADAHQPLNIGLAQDDGGARLTATFLGRPTTMRAIWDELLIEPVPEPTAPDGIIRLTGWFFQVDGPREYWLQTTPADWVRESLWIMRTPATGYVGNSGGLSFDELYVKQNRLVALEQIYKASLRLTQVLADALAL